MMTNPEPPVMPLPVPHPDVVARPLPDGSVLFHAQTEVYFGLNQTGAAVWGALVSGASSEEALVAAVMQRWPDAPSTDVSSHVRSLLTDLSAEGLLVDAGMTPG